MIFVFISILISMTISHYLLVWIKPLLTRRNLDIPNNRSSHLIPKPKSGGIAFIFSSFVGVIIDLLLNGINPTTIIFLISYPLSFLGFLDDKFNIKIHYRFTIQILFAALIIYFSPINISNILLVPLFILSIVSIINFINFMDGIDGLVAGSLLIYLFVQNILIGSSISSWYLVGGLIAFLFWNWSPAKIFMGDTGSIFLGGIYAAMALQNKSLSSSFFSLFISFPLLIDALTCVIRRWQSKQNIFLAHKSHLYQRLHQAGWSHSKVSLLYILGTLLNSLAYLGIGAKGLIFLSIIELLIGIILDKYFAKSFSIVIAEAQN